jgi:hypothetical protein
VDVGQFRPGVRVKRCDRVLTTVAGEAAVVASIIVRLAPV